MVRDFQKFKDFEKIFLVIQITAATYYQSSEEAKRTMRFTEINLCDIKSSNVDKLFELLPFVKTIFDQVLRPCPYEVKKEIHFVTNLNFQDFKKISTGTSLGAEFDN
jgi:hypothetical protein